MATTKLATGLWESAVRGSHWIADHQQPDGSWIGLNGAHVDAYYKGSWALSLTGQAAAANRQLNYVRRNLLQPDGDFLPRGHDYHINVMYLYSNPYFILGSVAAGRLDVATPAVGFLLTQQSADHGGFYARRAEPGRSEVCDTVCTSAAGLAALCAGQLQAARRAADNLAHVMALQPAPAERFFTTLDAAGKLITDDSARYRLIEAGVKKQMWFAVGLPFAFAVKMLEATGETRYRDLAQSYMAFQERGLDAWDVSSSGKAGWGCAMLYRMTGERRYREIALHIGEQIASKQDDSGSWLSFGSTGQGPGDVSVLTEDGLDVTQEYVLWLSLIAANILARDSE